jgi:ABC-2 type transport system permease protein
MNVLVIAGNSLRRLFRERTNLFFVFVLPLLLIVTLGLTVANVEPNIGVVATSPLGPAGQQLVDELDATDGYRTTVFADLEEALDLLQREDLTAVVVVPDDYDVLLDGGGRAQLEYLAIPDTEGFEVQGIVQQVVSEQAGLIRVSRLLSDATGLDGATTMATAQQAAENLAGAAVVTVDEAGEPYLEANAFGFVAAQELILFTFLISMTAAAALIQVRRLGVARRMVATPATTTEVIAGHALGRFAVVLIQSGFILGATALLFGVDWGSWPATAAIVVAFSLVATAAAMLVGALLSNENQSTAVGVSLGMALAALGGCMVPLEIFPDGLRTFAHITPHAWANDAFSEVLQRDGRIADVGTELAVLTAYGVALLALGTFALRRTLTT